MFSPVRKTIACFVLLLCMFTTGKAMADGGFIGGTLTTNTTLTPSGNPWTVFDTIIVPVGITLTIEQGTVLTFMINTHIAVYGTLIVSGAPEMPVVCRVKAPNGSSDKWKGLKFRDSRTIVDEQGEYVSGSLLQNLRITGADDGITLSDSSMVMASDISVEDCGIGINLTGKSRILLNNSVIRNCSYGISFRVSSNNSITGCTIANCGFGIMFHANNNLLSSGNLIGNNDLTDNDVALFIAYTNIVNNIITDNRVSRNGIGLHIGNGGEVDHGYNVIERNRVTNNEFGIKLSQHRDTVRYNEIKDNKVGMELYLASGNLIENNIISSNTNSGLQISEGSSDNLIYHNTIYSNFDGVTISGLNAPSVNNTFEYNRISDNSRYSFQLMSGPQQGIQRNTILSTTDSVSFVNNDSNNVIAYHNYWGTTDTAVINAIIKDIWDDPDKGEVLYNPFDGNAHPDAPIVNPRFAIKQLINNEVKVTWLHNEESDLAGYRVYIGADTGNFLETTDTTAVFQGILLTEQIRITAVDTLADGDHDQYEGHESSYTVAIAGPYAGGNSFVCSESNYFTSSATAIGYSELKWMTDGDGTFADATTLFTYYVPGTEDKATGFVHLTLKIITESGIRLEDSLKLTILDYLVAEAGADTTLLEGDGYRTEHAVAENFTTLEWITSGDGSFDNKDTLNTYYVPGTDDLNRGWVILTLRLTSDCGNLEDSFRIAILPGYYIRGSVVKDNLPVADSKILAYNVTGSETKAVTIATTDMEGIFTLGKIGKGDYFIYAVPDPASINDHFPTYYASRFNWSNAHLMTVENDIYDVDIDLKTLDMVLPQGIGSITGAFTMEGNPGSDLVLYNTIWYENQAVPATPNIISDPYPAPNHVILLMNPDLNKVIGWTLSDINGSFSFNNLPFGLYRLWGEKAGYTNKLSPIIYITPDDYLADNVSLNISTHQKTIETTVETVEPAGELVYPNPAKDHFYISALDFLSEEQLTVVLYNSRGIQVSETTVQRKTAASFGPVSIADLTPGMFYCVIKGAGGVVASAKVIRTR